VTYYALERYEPSGGYGAKALDAATRAIQADTNNAFAHAVMAYILGSAGDMEGMRREVEAQARDPRPAARYSNARGAYFANSGNWSSAIATYQQALVFDPVSPILLYGLAESYLGARNLNEADNAFRHLLAVAPDFDGAHAELALVQLWRGNSSQALAEVQLESNGDSKALTLVPIYRAVGRIEMSNAIVADIEHRLGESRPTAVADAYALAGNKDRAMDWLYRALDKGDPDIQTIRGDYYLYGFRDDPRYQKLLKQVKVPAALTS
jgi:tetratricopeptide (TPR) repeat protein